MQLLQLTQEQKYNTTDIPFLFIANIFKLVEVLTVIGRSLSKNMPSKLDLHAQFWQYHQLTC